MRKTERNLPILRFAGGRFAGGRFGGVVRFAGAALLALAGCGENAGSGTFHKLTLISMTAKVPASASVGQAVQVECTGTYEDSSTKSFYPPDVSVEVSPADSIRIGDMSLVASRPGSFEVRCKTALTSNSIAATITIRDGLPATVTTVLDMNNVRAGTEVHASCVAKDGLGNVIPGFTAPITSTPANGVSIQGTTIQTRAPGEYSIACAPVTRGPQVTPAQLIVTSGVPATVQIFLDQYEVRAGTQVRVTCDVKDAFGAPVQTAWSFTATPEPAAKDATSLTPTAAGNYQVACEVPAASLRSDPVTLQVIPALPARLTITGLTPQATVYRGGTTVMLTARIVDRFGNEAPAEWSVAGNPPTSALPAGHGAILLSDGRIQLVAAVTSETDGGRPVTDSIMVTVDARPPEVVFDRPRRAELVVGQPDRPMTITGHVTDPGSGVASLTINGQTVRFDASGLFTATMTPHWGVNLIEGTAVDNVGNGRAFAQSFELATHYRQANATNLASHRISDGIVAHLGQEALDENGDADIDDLSTIVRLMIQRLNFGALIPNPATTYHSDCSIPFVTIRGALDLHVDRITFGTPVIHLNAVNGGIHARIEVPSLVVAVHTTGNVCRVGVGVSGTASASRVTIDGILNISSGGGMVTASMPRPSVQIDNLNIHINLPSVISWAVDGIISLFRGAITSRVDAAFAQALQDNIPPLIRDYLRSFDLGTGFDLPAPLSLRLNVDSGLGRTAFDTNGATVGLDTTIYTPRGAIAPEPIGGILQETRSPLAFRADRALGVAISYDLINQALYSLWYGRGLNLDLTGLIGGTMPGTGIQARLEAMAPPVVAPSGNATYPFKLEAGDLRVTATIPPTAGLPAINAVIYGTIEIDARASVDAMGNFQVAVGPNPRIALEIDLPPEALIDTAMLSAVISSSLQSLLPQIVALVLRGIPIPRINLSQLAGTYLPPNIILGLSNPQLVYNGSFLMLEGNIEQVP